MTARKCPVCRATMLTYVNPPRQICPRANQHHKYLHGGLLDKKVKRRGKKK